MTLHISIEPTAEGAWAEDIEVLRAYNFGYAGRRQDDVAAHVEELKELGLPAPSRTPSIYPIDSHLVSAVDTVPVRGAETYGEAEFALVHGERGWYVGVASDHSDVVVEQVSTARAKTVYPDVVSATMWLVEDLRGHWDELILRGERLGPDGWAVIQEGALGSLLSPDALIAELETRSGTAASRGTAFVSGTIAGEILPGALAWRNSLIDPVLDRSLHLEYQVEESPTEI